MNETPNRERTPQELFEGTRELVDSFGAVLDSAVQTNDYAQAEAYKNNIEQRIAELRERLDINQLALRDKLGKEHEYFFVSTFNKDGIARVETLEGWTLIDTSGKPITDSRYNELGVFHDGIASVGHSLIDTHGNFINKDQIYEKVHDFSDGYSVVKINENTYGYMDRNGDFLDLPENLRNPPSATDFHEGYASVKEKNGGYRIINKRGEIINKDVEYVVINDCSEGYMPVVTRENMWRLLHVSTGEFLPIMNDNYSEIIGFRNGFCSAIVDNYSQYYYIDHNGTSLFGDKKFTSADHFFEGIARVQTKKNRINIWQYIDQNGGYLFGGKRFEAASRFSEGIAAVCDIPAYSDEFDPEVDGVYFINRQGSKIMEKTFATAGEFTDGVVEVRDHDTEEIYGAAYYINKRGERMFASR